MSETAQDDRMRYEWLVDTLRDRDAKVGVEIGVAEGDTSAYVLEHLPHLLRYYLVDPWTHEGTHEWHNEGRARNAFNACMERLEPYMGRCIVLRKRSWQARCDIPFGSADWCFIDGSHKPDDVRRDISLAERWVRPGGLICGHDWDSRKGAWDVKGPVLERYGEDRVQLGPDGVWYMWKGGANGHL